MSAWGTGPFENDDAMDLVSEIAESDPDAIRELLTDVLEPPDDDDDLDEVEGFEAFAVSALLAAAIDRYQVDSPEVLDAIAKIPSDAVGSLIPNARTLLIRLLDTDKSEFAEMWHESGRMEKVRGEVSKVQRALAAKN